MRLALLASLCFACSTSASPAPTEPALIARAQLDPWLQPVLDGHFVHGLVVGMVDGHGAVVYGYGSVGDTGAAPAGDTIFPVGSVSKTFTGLLLASQVEAGQLAPDTPVQQLVPAEMKVPTYDGTPIALEDLTTHTSGLPETVAASYQPSDPANYWADFSVATLEAVLENTALASKPGTHFAYSNVGEGLLGYALSRRAGTSWNEQVQRVIAGPLGLVDTSNALTATQALRRAPGYDGDLAAAEPWTFTEAAAGAGSLQSTANDLLAYAAVQAGITAAPNAQLGAAMARSQVPLRPTSIPGYQIGYNWIIGNTIHVVWHNGGVGDGLAFVGFDPDTHVGVVVLTDTAALGVGTPVFGDLPTSIGLLLLAWIDDARAAPPAMSTLLPTTVAVDAAKLQAYVGTYAVAGAPQPLAIALDNGRLTATAPWLFWYPVGLYPTSTTAFLGRSFGVAATFAGDGTTVALDVAGQHLTGKKQ